MKSSVRRPRFQNLREFCLRLFLLTCIFGRRNAYEVQLANSPRGKTCLKWTTATLSISVTVLVFDHILVSQHATFSLRYSMCDVYNTLMVLDNVYYISRSIASPSDSNTTGGFSLCSELSSMNAESRNSFSDFVPLIFTQKTTCMS